MIKIHVENKKNFVKMKDILCPAIVDKVRNIVYVWYDKQHILSLKLDTGQLIKKKTITEQDKQYFNTNVCWLPTVYLENKRSCLPCKMITTCQCQFNVERFNIMGDDNAGYQGTRKTDGELRSGVGEKQTEGTIPPTSTESIQPTETNPTLPETSISGNEEHEQGTETQVQNIPETPRVP